MLQIYLLKINGNLEKNEFNWLLDYLPKEKAERILRFYRFEDAQRCLLGDILARYAICKRCAVKNNDLVLNKNEFGKPLLLYPSGVHFNISHSGNWLVCAVDNNPVGIDVEESKSINLAIAERFFSKDEYVWLINQPQEMTLRCFYMLWTLKESYIKCIGKGLSIPLDSFSIHINNSRIYSLNTANNKISKYCFYQAFLDNNTVYGVCALDTRKIDSINFTTEQILKELQNTESFTPIHFN